MNSDTRPLIHTGIQAGSAGTRDDGDDIYQKQGANGLRMMEVIQLGEISITVTRKKIKNVYLSVHPPDGRVTLSAPRAARMEAVRAYALSKLDWIRSKQEKLRKQARETPSAYIEGESHCLWGRRYPLAVIERDERPSVSAGHDRITLCVRPGSDRAKRASVMHQWHKSLLHDFIPRLIAKWEPRLGVRLAAYTLRRMKTKWGSCSYRAGRIRFNTELVKKRRDLVEYVVVHELAHLIEPSHNERFAAILNRHYPTWREAQAELNQLPPATEI